jgi:hypothetical protein
LQNEAIPNVEEKAHAVIEHRLDDEIGVREWKQGIGDPCELNDEILELTQKCAYVHQ